MPEPTPMHPSKPRRKAGAHRLDPIDWREFANDAVLNGNMSTLFHRPPAEDPSAYASPEALVEIEKRARVAVPPAPAVSVEPPAAVEPTLSSGPSVGLKPVVPGKLAAKVKPLRDIYDALTLAGQVLYQAMYGPPDGTAAARQCAKGYRQLAAETHLDKDTVRDLIVEFKAKGIVRQIGSYNPDTRSSKTYEVLSGPAILEQWRQVGYYFVTSGRQRPEFCTAQGEICAPATPEKY
jgi:hypothetical protein